MTVCNKCKTVSLNKLGACEQCYSREVRIEEELIEIKRLLLEKVLPLLSRIDRNV